MQIGRLFEIVYILMDKKKVTAAELAEHFEVSIRTIYRDIEVLSGAGIPTYMTKGKNGGIMLMQEYVLNKIVMTKSEKEQIMSSLYAMQKINGTISVDERNELINRLGSFFGDEKAAVNWIEVDFTGWADGEQEAKLFEDIKSAVLNKKVISFEYRSMKKETTRREVEPLQLMFKGMSWYIYGYCRMRNDYRCFKLRRVKKLEVLNETFMRLLPKDLPKTGFYDSDYSIISIDNSTNNEGCAQEKIIDKQLDQCNKENLHRDKWIDAVLKIKPSSGARVLDEFDNYRIDEEGNFVINIKCRVTQELLYSFISYGADLEIIEPEILRNRVVEEIENILKIYKNKDA